MTIQLLDIKLLTLSEEIQARRQLNYVTVGEYATHMKDGAEFPPVLTYFDGETYWLADGFHRITAARDYADLAEFPAEIREGTKRDAQWYALGANQNYGERRLNSDLKKIAERVYKDPEWNKTPLIEIARHTGIPETTIRRWFRDFDASSPLEKIEKPAVRLATRNGTTYEVNTANIGRREPVARAEPERAPERESLFVAPPPEPEPLPIPTRIDIINGDAQQVASLVTEPVHLVVTSPPYNVGIEYDEHSDNLATYLPLLVNVWRGCHEVMADGARICVVVPFGVGRNPYVPFDSQIIQTLQDAGFTIRGRIVWDKNTTGNRTSWGSFRMASSPALRDTTECIIVAHKGSGTLDIPQEHRFSDDKGTFTPWLADSDYFMELAQDHWVVAPESAQRIGHPAPFPVDLVTRLIHFYAYPTAHVLDPFGGSGTTGVAAKHAGCNATLVELSEDYCALAERRINE